MLKQAIGFFQQQTYPHKQLVIVYEQDDRETQQLIQQWVTQLNTVQYLQLKELETGQWDLEKPAETQGEILALEVAALTKKSLGILRNLSVDYSHGDYVCQWDDDDWYRHDRLWVQWQALEQSQKPACALSRWMMYDELHEKAYLACHRKIGWEGSLLCQRSCIGNYADQVKAEDTIVLQNLLAQNQLELLDRPEVYVYVAHRQNTWERSHFDFLVSLSQELSPEETQTLKSQYFPRS
jgi:glycosyltransferase involved in cell wall biosynthesis